MMKENAVPKATPRKVKGTVLFTVVCVMMVLTVFLLGTLALAATANNRAVKNFSSVQTQQTAKAGVEAVMAAMRNNKDVATAVNNITATTPITNVSVGFEDPSLGQIESVSIEYAGQKYILDTHTDSTTKNQMVAKKVVRISATAVQGKARTTVSAYVLSDPDSGNSDSNNVTPSANGFVSTGGAGTSNHVSAYGGTAFGFEDKYGYEYDGGVRKLGADGKPIPLTSYVRNLTGYYELRNGQIEETDVKINGNLKVVASTPTICMKGSGSGVTVWGSFNVENDIAVITENSQFKDGTGYLAENMSYKDIPFWYVDNTLYINGTIKDVNSQKPTASEKTVLNIYCGELVWAQGDVNFPTNIYCFNEVDGTKEPDVTGVPETDKGVTSFNGNNANLLYNWSKSILQADGTNKTGCSGNFYSNGNVRLNSDGGCTFGTSGHSNVFKVQGDLTVVKGGHTINGDLYVGGNLSVSGGSLTVNGKVYYDGSVPSGITATGGTEKLSSYSDSEVERKLKTGYTQDTTPKQAKYWKDLNTGSGNFKAFMKQEWDGNYSTFSLNFVQKIDESAGQVNLKYDGDKLVYEGGAENGQEYPAALIPTYVNYYHGTEMVTMEDATELWYKNDASIDISKRGKKVEAPVIYPKEYTRDVLTGLAKYNDATEIDRTKVVTFPYEILTDANKTPYATYTDVQNSGRTDDHGDPISDKKLCEDNVFKLNGGVSVEKGSADGIISYDAGTKTYTIANSCSIKGKIDNEKILIQPPADTAIWIVILPDGTNGFTMGNADNNTKIILDDVSSTGTANILLKTDMNITAKDRIITTKKYETLLSSNASFQIYTDTKYQMTGVDVAPDIGINIYSDTNGRSINLTQNHCIIANINAPYCNYNSANNGISTSNAHIYYNRVDAQSRPDGEKKYGVIGQCIVQNFSSDNNWTLLYKPVTGGTVPPPGEDNFEDALMTSWAVLYWENY